MIKNEQLLPDSLGEAKTRVTRYQCLLGTLESQNQSSQLPTKEKKKVKRVCDELKRLSKIVEEYIDQNKAGAVATEKNAGAAAVANDAVKESNPPPVGAVGDGLFRFEDFLGDVSTFTTTRQKRGPKTVEVPLSEKLRRLQLYFSSPVNIKSSSSVDIRGKIAELHAIKTAAKEGSLTKIVSAADDLLFDYGHLAFLVDNAHPSSKVPIEEIRNACIRLGQNALKVIEKGLNEDIEAVDHWKELFRTVARFSNLLYREIEFNQEFWGSMEFFYKAKEETLDHLSNSILIKAETDQIETLIKDVENYSNDSSAVGLEKAVLALIKLGRLNTRGFDSSVLQLVERHQFQKKPTLTIVPPYEPTDITQFGPDVPMFSFDELTAKVPSLTQPERQELVTKYTVVAKRIQKWAIYRFLMCPYQRLHLSLTFGEVRKCLGILKTV